VSRRTFVELHGRFMRSDWLETLGLPPPTTLQEFHNTLRAFRERDPGGVGRDRVIPFAVRAAGAGGDIDAIHGAFRDVNLSNRDRWIYGDIMQPSYKEAVRFMNMLYLEGLVDRDFPLYADFGERTFEILQSGLGGFYMADFEHAYRDSPGIVTMLRENVPGGMFIPIDPFAQPDGTTPKTVYDVIGLFTSIPIFSRQPHAAMRYLNWLSRFENQNFLQIGPAGITHNMVNGIPQIIPATGLWIQNSNQNLDYTLPINGLDLGDPALNVTAFSMGYRPEFAPHIRETSAIALRFGTPLPQIPITLVDAPRYLGILIDKENELRVNAITAPTGQFDRIFDEGLRDWLNSGGQTVINERRARYPN